MLIDVQVSLVVYRHDGALIVDVLSGGQHHARPFNACTARQALCHGWALMVNQKGLPRKMSLYPELREALENYLRGCKEQPLSAIREESDIDPRDIIGFDPNGEAA